MTGTTKTERLHAALTPVLEIGPDFLAGRRHADDMAHTMVASATAYREGELARQAAGEDVSAGSGEIRHLDAAMKEIYVCGSGYLAQRCGADCVARTMTQIMGELGHLAPQA